LMPNLQVFGKLETDQQATLRSGVTAIVENVVRREGDWVDQGDLILTLERTEVELAVRTAQAAVRRAEAVFASVNNEYDLALQLSVHHESQSRLAAEKLQRFESLHTQRMIADAQLDEVRHEANERAMVLARHQATLADYPNQLDQARAAVDEAGSRLLQAEMDLTYVEVRSPFNGRVLRLDVARGDRVSAGAALLLVADFDRLQVRATVPVDVAHRLRKALDMGQTVVALASIAGDATGFELQGLAGAVKQGHSGIDAFFRAAPDALVALGSVVNLNLQLPAEADVIAVPVHAIYDNNRLYRIQDGRLQAVVVERVGEHLDPAGHYQILERSSELNRGDHIMVYQLPTSMTGLLVNPVSGSSSVTVDDASEKLNQWSAML
jgi:multidrug efflux pump subunit AcrA (membrane-fusion protein)